MHQFRVAILTKFDDASSQANGSNRYGQDGTLQTASFPQSMTSRSEELFHPHTLLRTFKSSSFVWWRLQPEIDVPIRVINFLIRPPPSAKVISVVRWNGGPNRKIDGRKVWNTIPPSRAVHS